MEYPPKKMALITSDYGINALSEHQLALITSGCAPLQTDMLVPQHSQHIVVTASLDSSVKLWDRKTMFDKDEAGEFTSKPIRRLHVHDRPVTGLLDLPHLDLVASWGQVSCSCRPLSVL